MSRVTYLVIAYYRNTWRAEVRQAADALGGIVAGNVLTPEDYECLTTIRKWIYRMEHER